MHRISAITIGLCLACAVLGRPEASTVLKIRGTVFSMLADEYIILSGKELFHIRKDGLTPATRAKIEKAQAHEILIDVPMDAIVRVRPPRPVKPAGS